MYIDEMMNGIFHACTSMEKDQIMEWCSEMDKEFPYKFRTLADLKSYVEYEFGVSLKEDSDEVRS